MNGRHAAPDDELPSFTGDVPEDLTLASRIVRRRFYWIFAQGPTGFGVAFLLVTAFASALGSVTFMVTPDGTDARLVPTIITLGVVAVGCGAASLIRPIPGPARFTLGAVPPAALLLAASVAGTSYDPALDYVPGVLTVVAVIAMGTYVVVAGLRFWSHFKRRLAEIDAARPPSAPPTR